MECSEEANRVEYWRIDKMLCKREDRCIDGVIECYKEGKREWSIKGVIECYVEGKGKREIEE